MTLTESPSKISEREHVILNTTELKIFFGLFLAHCLFPVIASIVWCCLHIFYDYN